MGASGTTGAAGNKSEAGTSDAAGASPDGAADVGNKSDAAAELAASPLPACPAFHVSEDCHMGSTGGGQSFAYCYVCKDSANALVTGCSNGPPRPSPYGNLCVPSCADCAP